MDMLVEDFSWDSSWDSMMGFHGTKWDFTLVNILFLYHKRTLVGLTIIQNSMICYDIQ